MIKSNNNITQRDRGNKKQRLHARHHGRPTGELINTRSTDDRVATEVRFYLIRSHKNELLNENTK